MNLRLGLFTYGMNDHLTGIGRYTVELAYALKRASLPLEIVLVSPYPESSLPWYRDFETFPVPKLKRLPHVLLNGDRDLSHAARILRLDILHDPCGIAPFFRTERDFARVVTIHDAIPLAHPENQPLMTKMVFRTFLKGARWTTDAVITVSDSAAMDIARYLKIPRSNLHVTPLATSVPSLGQLQGLRDRVPEVLTARGISPPYFIFVGEQNPRKNVPGIIEAFRRLRQARQDVSLVIAGPRNRKLPPVDGLITVGYVGDRLLNHLYVGAAGLVFPSFHEGFGIPLLEAMAHGTPVITSNTSSMPEVAGNAALLVNPHDPESIAAAMKRCLDPEVSAHLALSGRFRARQFSWDDTALQTWRVYQSVVKRPPRQSRHHRAVERA